MFAIFNKDFSQSNRYNPQNQPSTSTLSPLPNTNDPSQGPIMDPNIDPALFDLQPQPLPPTQALSSVTQEPETPISQSAGTSAQSTTSMLSFGPSWLPVPPSHQLPTPSPTISPSPELVPVPSQPIPLLLQHPISITVRWNIPVPAASSAADPDLNYSFNESLSSCHSELITITTAPTLSSLCFDIATAFDLDKVPTFAPAPGSALTNQYVIRVLRLKALKEKKWTTMLITESNFEEDILPLLHILARSGVTVEEAERIMFLEIGAGLRDLGPLKRYVSPYGTAMDVEV